MHVSKEIEPMKNHKQRGLPIILVLFLSLMMVALSTSGLVAAQGTPTARYDGVTVTVAGPAGQVECIQNWTSQWEQNTGGKVSINAIPFSDIDSKVLAATGTSTFLAD